ncbi:hypothetical protein SDC9_141112 [bioreactor metagenome]|uniref:Holin family protein n=1 Tax=bioreactor metagenome TaxID=1076179 RepID=A0A645DWR8_9ZZZZ
MTDYIKYFEKVFAGVKPVFAAFISAVSYIMFPDKSMMIALCMVLGASLLDIITKWVAICSKAGGYINAIKSKKLSSKAMWDGTRIKIFSYLIVAILTGMAYRVIYLQQFGILLASFVYTIMFLREFESNVENLCDSGSELKWLLLFTRKKSKEVLQNYSEEKPSKEAVLKDGENDSRI